MDQALRLMYGDINGPGANTSESTARYGVANDGGFQANLRADILDEETAVFAEGNFWIVPDRLRVTAGLRYSKVDLDFNQLNFGEFSGRIATSNGALHGGQELRQAADAEGRRAVPVHRRQDGLRERRAKASAPAA